MRRLLLFLLASVCLHLLILVPFFFFQDRLPLSGGTGVSVEIVQEKTVRRQVGASLGKLSQPAASKALGDAAGESAGSGEPARGEPTAGSANEPPTGAGRENQGSDLLLAEIRSRIERVKRYPVFARKSGVEGRALVRFQINRSGEPDGILLKTSSGSGILDQEAVETIRRAAPYPAYEDPLEIWIRFELKQ